MFAKAIVLSLVISVQSGSFPGDPPWTMFPPPNYDGPYHKLDPSIADEADAFMKMIRAQLRKALNTCVEYDMECRKNAVEKFYSVVSICGPNGWSDFEKCIEDRMRP
jgi:hypothetical protein